MMNYKVVEMTNKRIADCFHEDEKGHLRPWVCISCDAFVKKEKKRFITTTRLSKHQALFSPQRALPSEVISYYTYDGTGKQDYMTKIMLSPRACFFKDQFCICSVCDSSVQKNEIPLRTIANGFEIGPCPRELTDLNEIELAFISPIRVHGNIFTFFGGVRGVKGWHSFIKVDLKKVAHGLHQINEMGEAVPNLIAIVMSGRFTKEAKARTMKKNSLRRREAKAAFDWMNKNNGHFVSQSIGENFENLPDPILVDSSEETETSVDNIEEVDEFTVVFPDNTLGELNGGQKNSDEYKRMVSKVKDSNGDFFVMSGGTEYLKDFKGNNLSKAFPLQFPYGLGGPKDARNRPINSLDYLTHVINLSQPRFSHQLFVLVCYNMIQRQKMLVNATWRMKAKEEICNKFGTLTPDQIDQTLLAKTCGVRAGQKESIEFVSLVDAITRKLPHTNMASSAARQSVLAMQCHYGFPSVFFTVTFTDDNSFLIKTMADGKNATTDPISIADLLGVEKEEIKQMADNRKTTRSKHPGLCALNYEMLVDIIIECMIGWDDTKGQPTEQEGLFGIPEAYFLATEEQARKTLHAHFLLWLKHFSSLIKDLLSEEKKVRVNAIEALKTLVANVLSTKLIGTDPALRDFKNSHLCKTRRASLPVTVPDEGLRILRHQDGCRDVSGCIAACPKCGHRFSSEDLIVKYLISRHPQLEGKLVTLKEKDYPILDQLVYESRNPKSDKPVPEAIIQAMYNLHSQFHVKQCFKYDDECRYNLPQIPNKQTQIEVEVKDAAWYSWKGTEGKKNILRVAPKRGNYDVFMNTFCPAVSQSKLACNSNVRFLFGGSDAFYATKYSTKDTQREDTESYDEVLNYTKKRMLKHMHQSPFSESISRLIGATIVHNSRNIISAPMAAYLSRNNSRFKMSHLLGFIPMLDIKKYLDGKDFNTTIRTGGTSKYFESSVLNYILRPNDLKNINLFEFTRTYEVINITSKNKDDLMKFAAEHPGLKHRGVRQRHKPVLPRVSNFHFPDAALLRGEDILAMETKKGENNVIISSSGRPYSGDAEIVDVMEDYAMSILVLFKPLTEHEDIKLNDSYVQCLRNWMRSLPEKDRSFIDIYMQNIQDIRNASKLPRHSDKLSKTTSCYVSTQTKKRQLDATDDNDDVGFVDEELMKTLFGLNIEIDEEQTDGPTNKKTKTSHDHVSLFDLRKKGSNNLGFNADICGLIAESEFNKIEIELEPAAHRSKTNNVSPELKSGPFNNPDLLFRVIGRNTTRKSVVEGKEVTSVDATGTADSISKWGKEKDFDTDQQMAFETIVASFILTFHRDVENSCSDSSDDVQHFHERENSTSIRRTRLGLEKLCHKKKQLLLFMDGPGGSGKSTIIKEVLRYGSEFCKNIQYPFNEMTILVTATSGVAATLINGETIHRACHLNRKKPLTEEQCDAFKQVRLIIVDEISMASENLLVSLERNLRDLRQNFDEDSPYGGFNIVFTGDFRQLAPVGQDTIYNDEYFRQWNAFINCYIELKGMFRFKDDIEWGKCLSRFRQGYPSHDDFDIINRRVMINGKTLDGDTLPANIQYATFSNRDRCAINTGLFSELIKTQANKAVIVFSDNVQIHGADRKKYELKDKETFWTECSEDDIKFSGSTSLRIDPMLKLYSGCPLMVSENIHVRAGVANGTQATFQSLVLKSGNTVSRTTVDGIEIDCVFASQVSHILLQHNGTGNQSTFKLEPKKYSFTANYPTPEAFRTGRSKTEKIKMSAIQFPLISNNATTGHKLQGASKDAIYIAKFTYGIQNWPYVVLSRVRTRRGLFLREPLDPLEHFGSDPKLDAMTSRFRRLKAPQQSDYVYE